MDRDDTPTNCGLCGRLFTNGTLTKHHCLPKSKGGKFADIQLVCSMCHGMIHQTYTNETLAAVYPTIDQLRQAPELQMYIKWVRKQPITRRTGNKPRRRKL
jgi:hypothetical protein